MTNKLEATYPSFYDLNGDPLEAGYIYIGVKGLDPKTNPIQTYWNDTLTTPALQPLRTIAGYVSQAGTPSNVYFNNEYSITIEDKNMQLIYTNLSVQGDFLQKADRDDISLKIDSVDDLINVDVAIYNSVIVKDTERGGLFEHKNTGTPDDGNIFAGASGFWHRVEAEYNNASNYDIPREDTTVVNTNLSEYAESNGIFVDNLRQANFHESGAADGAFTFDISDDKFRVPEASRSYEGAVGECKSILYVGDSLTALNDNYAYSIPVNRRLLNYYGGLKEVSYLAYESTVISAKQKDLNMQLTQSGFKDLYNSDDLADRPYNSNKRKFSPDGKGFTIQGGDGTRFIKFTFNDPSFVRYNKLKLYYLQEPSGGTFDFKARGDSTPANVNTNGALSLQTIEVTPVLNGATAQYDIWIENVTGDVTVYGVYVKDEATQDGYKHDMFAISGGALWELLELENNSLTTYLNDAQPDTVLINIGTNDSSQLYDVTIFITNLTNYIARYTAVDPDIKFVIITPNNMQYTNFTGINKHTEYENARRKFARDNGYPYVDIPSEIGNFNEMWRISAMKDGTHPNARGLGIIGGVMGDFLTRNMRPVIKPNNGIVYPRVIGTCYFDATGGSISGLLKGGIVTSVIYAAVGIYDIVINKGDTNYNVAVSSGDGVIAGHTTKAGTSLRVTNRNAGAFSDTNALISVTFFEAS